LILGELHCMIQCETRGLAAIDGDEDALIHGWLAGPRARRCVNLEACRARALTLVKNARRLPMTWYGGCASESARPL
jgi:hypothetical protein